MKNSINTLSNLIVALVMLVFCYYLIGGNFEAKLGIIDDHEIMMFLGEDGAITPDEIPKILMTTEVGEYGEALRYRPVYYTLRIVESMIWQDNAQLWYGVRYIIFAYSFYLLWKILSLFFPRIISYLFVFYALTMPFWPDMLTRLGPSEIYTVPSLMLFVWGMTRILQDKGVWTNWIQLGLGYVVCVGSKENFLFLLPILFLLIIYRMIRKKIGKIEMSMYVGLIIFTIFITRSILLATGKASVDMYETQINYGARIAELVSNLGLIIKTRHALPSIIILATYLLLWGKSKLSLVHPLTMFVLFGVIASQYILYNNTLPTNSRYDFPAMLLFRIIDLASLLMLIKLFSKTKLELIAKIGGYIFLSAYMIYFIMTRQYTLIHNSVKLNNTRTNHFSERIEMVENKLLSNSKTPLVFVSYRYLDFEPIISISRYLTASGAGNKLHIEFVEPKISPDDSLGLVLSKRMLEAGKFGGESEELFSRFSPITEMEDGGECYSISFGRERESEYGCELITFF